MLHTGLVFLDGNNVTGQIPESWCNAEIPQLYADCGEIQCSCCTYCCNNNNNNDDDNETTTNTSGECIWTGTGEEANADRTLPSSQRLKRPPRPTKV